MPEFWRDRWEARSREVADDYSLDRGRNPWGTELERLAQEELMEFIAPRDGDVILDAGCGTGLNLLRLAGCCRKVVGFDYARGMVDRAKHRLEDSETTNGSSLVASATDVPLASSIFDRAICMSVLQYLNDEQARRALGELVRVVRNGGEVILHVKNLSSLYLSTLLAAKKAKRMLGRVVKIEYYRTYKWYMRELESLGCMLVGCSSANLLVMELLPKGIVRTLQRVELSRTGQRLVRQGFLSRHGADLKIKVRVSKRPSEKLSGM